LKREREKGRRKGERHIKKREREKLWREGEIKKREKERNGIDSLNAAQSSCDSSDQRFLSCFWAQLK